jgi:hypothetical protein
VARLGPFLFLRKRTVSIRPQKKSKRNRAKKENRHLIVVVFVSLPSHYITLTVINMMNLCRKSGALRQIARSHWKRRPTDSIVRSSVFLDLPKTSESGSQIGMESSYYNERLLSPLSSCSQLQSSLYVGWSSSELAALQDATILPSTNVLEAKEFRIIPSAQTIVTKSGGGESHRRHRNHYHCNFNIPTQSPWLQQLAQFSTSPTPPSDSSSSSVPPSLSVAARTAPRPVVKHKLDPTRIPTPPSEPEMNPLESLTKTSPRSIVRKGVDVTISAFTTLLRFFFQLPGNLYYYLTHPTETRQKYADMKQAVKDEIHHYWVGFKVRGGIEFFCKVMKPQTHHCWIASFSLCSCYGLTFKHLAVW